MKKRKRIEAQRAKPSSPSQASDALIGDEEQNGKQKKNKKKETGIGFSPRHPGPFGHKVVRLVSLGELLIIGTTSQI